MDEERKRELCVICVGEVLIVAFKGTGVCCENCRKRRDGETTQERSLAP